MYQSDSLKTSAAVASLAAAAVAWAASYGLCRAGNYLFSGFVLIALALAEYLFYYSRERHIFQMEAVFSLFWIGGVGLSAMKLSNLAQIWENVTWLSFFLVYVCFIIGYEGCRLMMKRTGRVRRSRSGDISSDTVARRLLYSIFAILIISSIAFIIEAAFCEVPLFSDKPHAYSEFHISGVHYFTVTGIFVLPLSVLYKSVKGRLTKREWTVLIVCCALALMVPVLCVSRFQLIMAVMLALCVAMAVCPGMKLRYVILIIAALIPVYIGLTVARNHDVAYLNGIFDMKNAATPIFFTQPYMYVANNYDNFNCLVTDLPAHTHGLRQLFPVFAFTGLKFIRPELVNFPIYVTKEELTTVTLIYDAYYDFGVVGVAAFGLILGFVCHLISRAKDRSKNPVAKVFYAQITMYLAFSFFTTWFSNPTTWFWLGVTGIVYVYVELGMRKTDKGLRSVSDTGRAADAGDENNEDEPL